ncbi:MAG: putative peptidoglycan glycosyltransferase FtsW [Chlamydiota bacterium]
MKKAFFLLFCIAIIFSMGLLMVFNTTSAEVLDRSLTISTHFALIKQIIYAFIGAFIGVCCYFFGYRNFLRITPFLFFLTIVFLILVFIPGIGHTINGARRWIGFFGYTLQPSEFAKYILPIYALFLFLEKGIPDTFFLFVKRLGIFLVPLALILFEPDNGTTVIILVVFIALFILVKVRFSFWGLPVVLVIALGSVIAYNMPHVPDRIRVYLHPELDIKGKGHQPFQARIAAGSGGLVGKGFGQSLQKLDYLPEARNDYIAAIYAEEMGFIGIAFLIGLYMAIAYFGFSISLSAMDREGFYLGAIMTFLISFQAFLNLGIVSGLLPSKGTTLPFFSQGGTSLIVNIIAISLLMSIAAVSAKEKKMVI